MEIRKITRKIGEMQSRLMLIIHLTDGLPAFLWSILQKTYVFRGNDCCRTRLEAQNIRQR
ncbi:hypothetical protein RSP799_22060 [Ralstonia solanacearum]|nr:hypothetical protein RSP799_22060 [Ralstonia solanacearum]